MFLVSTFCFFRILVCMVSLCDDLVSLAFICCFCILNFRYFLLFIDGMDSFPLIRDDWSLVSEGIWHIQDSLDHHIVLDRPWEYKRFFFSDAAVQKNIVIDVVCSDVSLVLWWLVLGIRHQPITRSIDIHHRAPRTHTNTSFLTLAFDHAQTHLAWSVTIHPDQQQSSGHLHQKTLLLGTQTKTLNKPVLDIRANDVKASHGATMQKIDPLKLFYMQAKWLSRFRATAMIVQSELDTLTLPFRETEWSNNSVRTKLTEAINSLLSVG